jgi:spore coat polysaccharide biosynthesis protein SpsF (cytidylyltransferase family)
MVGISVSALAVKHIGRRMATDQVVGRPLYIIKQIPKLAAIYIRGAVLHDTPAQHGDGIRHGKIEFDMVARIVPAAGKVQADVRAVVRVTGPAPWNAVP